MGQAIGMGVRSVCLNLNRLPDWSDFLSNALHLATNKPLHKTHCIIIGFEFGFSLGQVSGLVSFEVLPIPQARTMCPHTLLDSVSKENLEQCLNVESSPTLLASRQRYPRNIQMAVLFTNKMASYIIGFPQMSEYYPETISRILPELSDRVAVEAFRRLQATFQPID